MKLLILIIAIIVLVMGMGILYFGGYESDRTKYCKEFCGTPRVDFKMEKITTTCICYHDNGTIQEKEVPVKALEIRK